MMSSTVLDCHEMPLKSAAPSFMSQVVCFAGAALASLILPGSASAGDPAPFRPSARPVAVPEAAAVKVFVDAFRGAAGKTTAKLVRADFERGGVVELIPEEGADAFSVQAEATGGWIDVVVFQPGGRVLFQRRYESPNLRQNVHRFTDDFTAIATQRPGIASSVIAFVSDFSGDRQVYICDSDGEDIRRVTTLPRMQAVNPFLSLDNSKVIFTAEKAGFADIWAIDLATGEGKRLINAPGDNRCPVLSPDGNRLAVTMSYTGMTDLYVTTAEGGRGRRLTEDAAVESSPTWSPDGRHLAYARRPEGGGVAEVCHVSSLGGAPVSLPMEGLLAGSGSADPDWSPDGRRIALTIRPDSQPAIAIFDVHSRNTRIIDATEGAASPTWAPDSRHLAFRRGNALWVLDTRSGRTARILSDFGNVSEPRWSR